MSRYGITWLKLSIDGDERYVKLSKGRHERIKTCCFFR